MTGEEVRGLISKKCGEDPSNLSSYSHDQGKEKNRDVWRECQKRIWDDYYYWNPKGEVTEVKNN